MSDYISKNSVIKMLIERKAGRSLRVFGGEVGVSAMYLSDILTGRRDPGPKILDYLGLGRESTRTVKYLKLAQRRVREPQAQEG